MKLLRGIVAGFMLACSASIAFAQTNPGSSPLTGAKGGTNNAFMQFSGPASSLKTYTLPNVSDTLATWGVSNSFTQSQTVTQSQNGLTSIQVTNSNAGTTALAALIASNGTGGMSIGAGSAANSTAPFANRGFINSAAALGGMSLVVSGIQPLDVYINLVRVGGFTSAGAWTLTTPLDIPSGGTGGTSQVTARTNLGLGGLATITPGTGIATALGNNLSANGGVTGTIASGATALGTSAISSATCATVVTSTATNTTTTDGIIANFNGDPSAITGYIPSTAGMLTIFTYPTSNNVNFKVCNNTGVSITPGAVTVNWRVVR